MNNAAIIQRLRERMAELGVKPQMVSKQATGSTDTVRNWLRKSDNGESFSMRQDTLAAVAAALSVPTSWLLFGEDETDTQQTGFKEETATYTPKANETLAVKGLYGEVARNPQIVRKLQYDLTGFGLYAGDLIITDLAREAVQGELVLVWIDDGSRHGSTVIRRLFEPYLLGPAPRPGETPLRTNDSNVTVRYPVVGAVRFLGGAEDDQKTRRA